jgi:hypothetical protein
VVESGAQIDGHFAIRLRDCARFRFRIGLFADAAQAESVSPEGYLGGLLYESTGSLGYELSIGPGGGGNDTPRLILANKSETLEVTRMVFTVGDTSRAFDAASIVLGSTTAGVRGTIVTPDEVQDGIRSESVEVTFTGLTPGRSVSIATDLDRNNANTTEDFTRVFFNNGDMPNSTVRVEFSDGRFLTQTLPDGSAPGNTFVFSQSEP